MRINLEELTTNINSVISETHSIINALNDGQRIKIPELAERVGEKLNTDSDELVGIINYFVHNIEGFYTEKGRIGGVYKGTKPNKNI